MKFLILFAAAFASLSGYARTYTVTGTATFHANGTPGIVNIDGEGAKVVGQAEASANNKVTGTFTVQLKTLTTGMSLRDDHMHAKFLQDSKYPEARLVLKPWPRSSQLSPFTGDFSLHGVTKPVTGQASVTEDGHLHAEFYLDITAYGIAQPSMGPVTVDPKINVVVDADVK